MENSKIQWTDHTFNPWAGCARVSPGCDHCYAESWAKRTGNASLWQGDRRRTSAANWAKPLRWNREALEKFGRPARVFCASLADVFDNQVPDEWRADLWDLIRATPHLDWLLLTKRPQNIAKMLPADWGAGYANVWLGVTAENQEEADRRIPLLLETPAAVRFVSYEPALGPVDFGNWLGLGHGNSKAHRDIRVSSSGTRRAPDRRARADLASSGKTSGPLDGTDEISSLCSASSGAWNPLSVGPRDDRWEASNRVGPSAGMAPRQRSNTLWHDGEPQERHQDGQPAVKSGIGDALGADAARDRCVGHGEGGQPGGGAQRYGETHGLGSTGNSTAPGYGGTAEIDRDGLRSFGSDDLKDRQRTAAHIDWLICGGESGPGARPFDVAWARSVVSQCKDAGLACFVKQLGARPFLGPLNWTQDSVGLRLNDRKGGDMSEWPEDLRVREFPDGQTT